MFPQAGSVKHLVLDQGIDTSTAVGRMFFQILCAIAEFEHALMSERTRDGLAATRVRSRTGGQKPKLGPQQGGRGASTGNPALRNLSVAARPVLQWLSVLHRGAAAPMLALSPLGIRCRCSVSVFGVLDSVGGVRVRRVSRRVLCGKSIK
jgi:hypothetical protein